MFYDILKLYFSVNIYFVAIPFAAITAAQRCGIDSISRLIQTGEILSHSSFNDLNNAALFE